MKCFLIRFATMAASCCLLAGGLALPADAATPVPPTNVITIPSAAPVSDTVDGNLCPWRMADVALVDAPSHPMSQAEVSSYASLVAALCSMSGS